MSDQRPLAYVDLSGYALTGKHAAIDLLREFRGFCVARFDFEFNVLRIQGGIRDLETALVNDWSPIRSNAAIQRFRLLIDRLSSKNSWLQPSSWFHATGWNYEDFFRGRFRSRSTRYLTDLIEAEWMTEWPYGMAEMHGIELFRRKVLRLIGVRSAFDTPLALAAPGQEAFLTLTRTYLADLMAIFADGSGAHTVVMHNSCEPFNPGRALRYFYDGRSIIVDRDPRDTYVAQVLVKTVRMQISPEIFAKRYRLYRELAKQHPDPPERVMRIRFESLVLNYEATLARIYAFLKMVPADHLIPRRYFKPEESSKNIDIWRSHPKQAEIEYIRKELSEFCYQQ